MAQTAFGHNIEYFCFLRCLLDRGQVIIMLAVIVLIFLKPIYHTQNEPGKLCKTNPNC